MPSRKYSRAALREWISRFPDYRHIEDPIACFMGFRFFPGLRSRLTDRALYGRLRRIKTKNLRPPQVVMAIDSLEDQ